MKNKKDDNKKCIICNKKASGEYTTDIDVRGLPFCKSHKSKVSGLMIWLLISEELFNDMLKLEKKLYNGK